MTKAYIVVEGEADKAFLERLLEPRLLQDVLMVVAEARYGILLSPVPAGHASQACSCAHGHRFR